IITHSISNNAGKDISRLSQTAAHALICVVILNIVSQSAPMVEKSMDFLTLCSENGGSPELMPLSPSVWPEMKNREGGYKRSFKP
ncbi:MAG: hypothetical protein K2O58_10705, partial [Bacteroidales bacterium]|nr:hypothetical protein [Bacteroidales bacterium]